MAAPSYEVLALRYATRQNRSARENFIATDTHDAPMPLSASRPAPPNSAVFLAK
jgi:hypothetical protein